MSILWEWDAVSSDDLFQRLLAQAHSKDQHALGIDSIKFVYTLQPEAARAVAGHMTIM